MISFIIQLIIYLYMKCFLYEIVILEYTHAYVHNESDFTTIRKNAQGYVLSVTIVVFVTIKPDYLTTLF